MKDDFQTTVLGDTGLKVGRLGLAASYGAPAPAFEEACEKGCNYFYLGSGRHRSGMKTAIRNLCRQGLRDKLVISIQTYARFGFMTEFFFKQSLKSLGIDHADVLILGWHNSAPFSTLLDFALKMKEQGLCRFIGMSGHNRSVFPKMAQKNIFDLFHIRYNPAHRGAQTDCFPLLDTHPKPGIVTYTATRWGHLLDPKYMPPGEPALDASDCYRFSLSNPSVDICLCGPKNIQQMRTALTSLESGPLDTREMERIKIIGDHVHKTAKSFFS
ncbi:MAG: aldo/keto reductase [Proteobacteria bacterium]|nr:aldo/keto reductase [Pseudomonadota bacterium]MBU1585596.1 aldo/keto reductase [Pseudomonadota bacterium]MBU2455420.1 aldo/keto reductase [Pseudomonadota bacterium]MBU2631701.1 aldo/keto reductase [Pseudomonadota bacterium]